MDRTHETGAGRERDAANSAPRRAHRIYLLFVLTFAFTMGFADRQILNLLVDPIKQDFDLTDVQISLLQGVAFSLTYLLFTPVLGRIIDNFSRTKVLAAAVTVWSFFTLLGGLVSGYRGLVGCRAAVGAAEGALTPSVYSILGDTFSKREMAVAFSIVLTAPYLGGGMALLLGGFLIDAAQTLPALQQALPGVRPWQFVFIVISLPGFLCALLLLALREPSRHELDGDSAKAMPLGMVWSEFRRRGAFYWRFYLGMSTFVIPIYAFPAWIPAFLGRRFAMPIKEIGFTYGVLTLICGITGVLAGPWISRALRKRFGETSDLRVVVYCGLGIVASCLAMYFATTPLVVLAAASAAGFFYSAPTALAASALQAVTPGRMRGVASSVYVVMSTITGLALAPFLVAALTQYVFADETMVGLSLAIVAGGAGLLAATLISSALPHYLRLRSNGESTEIKAD